MIPAFDPDLPELVYKETNFVFKKSQTSLFLNYVKVWLITIMFVQIC